MEIALSWNIFVTSLLALIVAYSIILERSRVMSVIVATFIAVMVADAVHNLLVVYLLSLPQISGYVEVFTVLGIPAPLYKVSLFLLVMVGLTRSRLLQIETEPLPWGMEVLFSGILGLLSGLMMISIILIYFGGGSFLMPSPAGTATFLAQIRDKSTMVNVLMEFYQVWFLLPLMSFIPWKRVLRSKNA